MSVTRVKICGLTNAADARAAVDCGADAVGFILYPKSKRFIAPDRAAKITRSLPPYVQRVAVLVNDATAWVGGDEESGDEWLDEDDEPGPDTFGGQFDHFDLAQFHGEETPDHCDDALLRVVKVLHLSADGPLPDVTEYKESDNLVGFLLDTPSPDYGGTGKTFDWSRAVAFRNANPDVPVILSGGLTVENVAEAIKTVQPYAVDVASGVEVGPGQKDHALMRKFIEICHSQ